MGMTWKEYARHRAERGKEYARRHPVRADLERAIVFVPPFALMGTVLLAAMLIADGASPTYVAGGIIGAFASIAVGLAWLGALRWRETGAPQPLGLGIGFAALPAWGLVELLCIRDLMARTPTPYCGLLLGSFYPVLGWVFAWFFVPILVDFARFRERERSQRLIGAP